MHPFTKVPRRVASAVAGGLLVLTLGAAATTAAPTHTERKPPPMATIVLVHGAWADGSSWAGVTKRLQRDGYPVDVEANPLRGVASDALYLKDVLSQVTGPVVLVAHSYGGMVTTNAATGNPNIKALVYVDAYIPDSGESVFQLTTAQPGSALDPATSFDAVQVHNPDGTVAYVDLYVKQALFPDIFAGGIPARKARILASGQRPLTLAALSEPSPGIPAWKTIPSWALIGTADKVIPPAEQKAMATRAGAHIIKIPAPHLSMVANPDAVTRLIEAAATAR